MAVLREVTRNVTLEVTYQIGSVAARIDNEKDR